ncbi:MAG: hypothetical protein HY847_06535 [Betaproteobacteria bacterium]|nr:hypothetical protein [Betaproteobacteria bacterium]
MNTNDLILLLCVLAFAVFLGGIVPACRRSPVASEALPSRSVTDPVLPAIQAQAVARLIRLPHFRRIPDGSLVDFYCGSRLTVCGCKQLPYPHLVVQYGDALAVAFESDGALEQYVAVQEAIAPALIFGVNLFHSTAAEDR